MFANHILGVANEFGNIGNWNTFLEQDSNECMAEAMGRCLFVKWPREFENRGQSFVAPDIGKLLHGQAYAAAENERPVFFNPGAQSGNKPIGYLCGKGLARFVRSEKDIIAGQPFGDIESGNVRDA